MNCTMLPEQRTCEDAKEVLSAVLHSTTVADKMAFYDKWADTYDQDVGALDYLPPNEATKCITSHFAGDRGSAAILDLACGTGLMAKQLKEGFLNFVGIDGSPGMLEQAKESGLYQELKQCILGEQPLPVKRESFDVVVMCGALCVGHVPVHVVRDLFDPCKKGGFVCLTCRKDSGNVEYKAELERELKRLENEGLCSCVTITEVDRWMKAGKQGQDGYLSGSVYLYKKL
ncbi:methyltransferase-like protein 27 [Thalassophryne amazonica]|uniref:methyltransferase-like protein 27 n=1 Tax=Thalassophryne amazonica TaxID=390379 RepID=UPI0014725913|nr:methyltransferase-like protein 27 [Thalassophryne amazonica]